MDSIQIGQTQVQEYRHSVKGAILLILNPGKILLAKN